MKLQLPCKGCVVLGACTSKNTIKCEMLTSFLYYADFLVEDELRDKMRNEVRDIFNRRVMATMPDANLIALEKRT